MTHTEWWQANQETTVRLLRKHGAHVPSFPKPTSPGFLLLADVEERGPIQVADLAEYWTAPGAGFSYLGLKEYLRRGVERGSFVRVRHGWYGLGPDGQWWLGFQRFLAAERKRARAR